MESAVSICYETLERQLGRHIPDFQVFQGCQNSLLYDQRHRITEFQRCGGWTVRGAYFQGLRRCWSRCISQHSKPHVSGQCQFATGEKCEANCQLCTRSACLNSRDHKIVCSRHALLDKGMSWHGKIVLLNNVQELVRRNWPAHYTLLREYETISVKAHFWGLSWYNQNHGGP